MQRLQDDRRKKPIPLPHSRPTLLRGVFGLDLRSLAVFRVGFALFLLYDLLSRSFDLTAHYADAGTMPRLWAVYYFAWSPVYSSWSPAAFSLHMATGAAIGVLVLFLINAGSAIGLLLGYRTRLMTFVSWFLLASLHARNPLVLSVGDDVLRVFLFFAIFLPLGARYSIDAALNPDQDDGKTPDLYATPATAVFYLQLLCVYFFSALLKNGVEWRSEGTALYYAFNIDQYAFPLARYLLGFPELLKVLTFAVWGLELASGFILLIPHPLVKLIGILLLAGLQCGIGWTLALGHNPWVNTLVLIPFLPGTIWNRRLDRPRVEVIYDGDCGFCRKMASIVVELIRPRLMAPPRAAEGRDLAVLRRENSWIVRSEEGANHFRFEAIIRLVSASPIFFFAAPLLRFKPFYLAGTALYRWVAGHRGVLARITSPLRFRPLRYPTYWWREALVVFFFIVVLSYNAAALFPTPSRNYLEIPALLVRLEQYWGMFAPAPTKQDGWYVVEGRLRDGTLVDAFRETREIHHGKPVAASDFYPNERWRRYIMNLGNRDFKDFRAPFTNYLCRNWNQKNSGPDHMEQIRVFFMRETTPPPGQPAEVTRLELIDFKCSN